MVSISAAFEELQKNIDSVAEKTTYFGAKYVMCSRYLTEEQALKSMHYRRSLKNKIMLRTFIS